MFKLPFGSQHAEGVCIPFTIYDAQDLFYLPTLQLAPLSHFRNNVSLYDLFSSSETGAEGFTLQAY